MLEPKVKKELKGEVGGVRKSFERMNVQPPGGWAGHRGTCVFEELKGS